MKRIILSLAVALFAIGTAVTHAQATNFKINPSVCGVKSVPLRCIPGINVTDLTDGTVGTVGFSYKSPNYPNYNWVTFQNNLDGLGGLAITAQEPDGSYDLAGYDNYGTAVAGRMHFDYATKYSCSSGHPVCATHWWITGGAITITRIDH